MEASDNKNPAQKKKLAVEDDRDSLHSKSSEALSFLSFSVAFCVFNIRSKRFRRLYFFQMMVLPFVPIIALLVQNVLSLINYIQHLESMKLLQSSITEATEVGRVLSALQTERSEVTFYILSNGSLARNNSLTDSVINQFSTDSMEAYKRNKERFGGLAKVFRLTDVVLGNITNWQDVATLGDNSASSSIFQSKLRFQIRLEDLRETINKSSSEMHQQVEWYYAADEVFLEVLNRRVTSSSLSSEAIRSVLTYVNIIRAIEHFGVLTDYGLRYIRLGELQPHSLLRAVRSDTLFWEYINNTRSFSAEMLNKIHVIFDSYEGMESFQAVRGRMLRDVVFDGNVSSFDPTSFYLSCITLTDRLRKLQKQLATIIEFNADTQLSSAYFQQTISITLMGCVMILSPIIILIIRRTAKQIEEFSDTLEQKTLEAKKEKSKTDRLLKQLLPSNVVVQLKSGKGVPAESFEAVTIYFSDIVGFTSIASISTPIQVVTFLNSLYKLFDLRTDRYNIYKVETIGDAYMCVSGLPKRNGDLHAVEVADMSLDLLIGISKYRIPHLKDQPVQIRIGLHSGPCVAGIVGSKMPRYCLFGDTINIASALESTGKPQMIHISDKTHRYLDENGSYLMEYRGKTAIKGRDPLDTYWLLDKKSGLPKYVELPQESDDRPDYIKHQTFK